MHHQTLNSYKLLTLLANNVRLARSQYVRCARILQNPEFPEEIFHRSSIQISYVNVNRVTAPHSHVSVKTKEMLKEEKPDEKKKDASQRQKRPDEKPNRDLLQKVHDNIINSVTKLFSQPMDYSIYNPSLVFVDNIRSRTSHGILRYVQQVAWLRVVGHLKFAYVKLDVLNTHISEEEGRITVRWRITGISGFRVMLKFWKFRLWNWKEIMRHNETWYDGVSYFDVGSDGLVYRHIADKVMEDKDRQVNEVSPNKAILAAKLGVLSTLFPQSSLCCSKKCDTSLHSNRI